MINSVNGDPAKMGEIFPLAKKYGSKVIALTSSREGEFRDQRGTPEDSPNHSDGGAEIWGSPGGYLFRSSGYGPLNPAWKRDFVLGNPPWDQEKPRRSKDRFRLSNISFGLPSGGLSIRSFSYWHLGAGWTRRSSILPIRLSWR